MIAAFPRDADDQAVNTRLRIATSAKVEQLALNGLTR